jgi:hypothetical protein
MFSKRNNLNKSSWLRKRKMIKVNQMRKNKKKPRRDIKRDKE